MQDNPPSSKGAAGGVFVRAHLVAPRALDLFIPSLPGCFLQPPPQPVFERHFSFKRKEEEDADTHRTHTHLPEDLSLSGHFTVGLTKRKRYLQVK